jgi:hypothetical protein
MSDIHLRLTPALADRYRIERELGAGGMATVYRAHDVRHDRDVAIKVLHPDLGAMLGAQRFLAEITTTAKLQHPHILPLLDSGEADGLLFYVMPVVDGESLRARLTRETQLPIDEAIRITREVASALDYSHRHGIVHRDIKPENILLHDGQAVVADFGIALAVSNAGGARMTATGLSLGTPQYMSPEQATGERTVDARSDIYSLGCVLYEMLTGAPPFVGATAQAIVAQVITSLPSSVSTQRPTVSPYVDHAVARALQKLPADRFQTASAFADALSASGGHPILSAAARRGTRFKPGVGLIAAAASLAFGAVLGALIHRSMAGPPSQPSVRILAPIPRHTSGQGGLTVAADGRLAIVVGGDDASLFVRRLNEFEFSEIPGTQGAQNPFLSPDAQWVAFVSKGRLRKVRLDGGPIVDLADATWGGGTWGSDGTIVFTPATGLSRTTTDGKKPEILTTPDTARGEFGHWWPQFLPDGHTVIFTNYRTPYTKSRLEALDLRTGSRRVLIDGAVGGVYAGSGHLLFSRGSGTVFAVAFDSRTLETHGDAKPVLEDVDGNPAQARMSLAISANGTLVFLPRSQWSPKRALVWIDRSGKETPAIPQPDYYSSPRVSPDGRLLAYTKLDEGRDIWLYDRTRSLAMQVTRNDAADFDPVWTVDGQRLVYISEHGAFQLYYRRTDLTEPEYLLLTNAFDKFPTSVSPDAALLAFTQWDPDRNIRFLALNGRAVVPTFPNSDRNEENAAFSPDGRWIAYTSDESGKKEVYARAFPNMSARRIQISIDGGTEPRWTRNAHEIVFRRGNALMAVAFEPATGTPSAPVTLFSIPYVSDGFRNTYDAMPDGSRFLMTKPLFAAAGVNAAFITNWFPELEAKLAK